MRIGVFLNNINQPKNWELYLLKKIIQTPSIDLKVILATPPKQKNKSIKSIVSYLLNWQITRETILSNKEIALTKQESISKKEWSDILKLPYNQIREKPNVQSKLKKLDIEILIDLTIGAVNKDWVTCSKFGLWHLHFGKLSVSQKGIAPGFWETYLKLPLTEIYLLQQLRENENINILNHGHYYRWKTWSKNNSALLDNVASLVQKSLSLYHPEHSFKTISPTPIEFQQPTLGQAISYISNFWREYWKKDSDKAFNKKRWTLFTGKGRFLEADLSQLTQIAMPKNEFWADPFFFEYQQELYIFFECFPSKTQKGIICCGKWKDQQLHNVETVLDLPYHLSYPFIFEEDDKIYMIPETCRNERLEIYICTDFPRKWELFATGFQGESIADTFYYKDDQGSRWLFLNKAVRNNGHITELHIFKIDSLRLNNIQPHTQNPVIIDARVARNGGAIYFEGDQLIRPSQNNSMGIYGYGLNLNQIIKLSIDEYEEKTIKKILPNFDKNITAVHHLHQFKNHFIIDGMFNYT